MNESNALQLISQLAETLGTTTEHLWEVLTRQAFLSAVDGLLITLAFIAVSFGAHFLSSKMKKSKNKDIVEGSGFVTAFMVIIIGFAIIGAFSSISALFQAFVNPEFYAFKQIANILQ